MMRFFISIFLIFSVPAFAGQQLKSEVAAEAAIMINGYTGDILFEKNKDKSMYPASVTKVATALYILKKHSEKINDKVVAKKEALASITTGAKKQSNYRSPPHFLETDGSHIGIKIHEEFNLQDLLCAMLVASANDAANVLAIHLEGSVSHFMEKMNAFLKEIGCTQTHFLNPHGLHHPQHKTTAHDMALMAKEAMTYPLFRKIVAMSAFTIPQTNLSEERRLTQTNHLIRAGQHYYKKATGIKTGYMSQAKKTLVASASDENRMLIAVVLGCDSNLDRYKDVTTLFDKAFQEKKTSLLLLPQGTQKIKAKVPHGKTPLTTYLKEPLTYEFYPSEKKGIDAKILWKLPSLPIGANQEVGMAVILNDQGEIMKEVPMYALEEVKPALFYKIFGLNKGVFKWIGGGIGFLILIRLFKRKKRRRSSNVIG